MFLKFNLPCDPPEEIEIPYKRKRQCTECRGQIKTIKNCTESNQSVDNDSSGYLLIDIAPVIISTRTNNYSTNEKEWNFD